MSANKQANKLTIIDTTISDSSLIYRSYTNCVEKAITKPNQRGKTQGYLFLSISICLLIHLLLQIYKLLKPANIEK